MLILAEPNNILTVINLENVSEIIKTNECELKFFFNFTLDGEYVFSTLCFDDEESQYQAFVKILDGFENGQKVVRL
jgi:hypothetical protein